MVVEFFNLWKVIRSKDLEIFLPENKPVFRNFRVINQSILIQKLYSIILYFLYNRNLFLERKKGCELNEENCLCVKLGR
jgi:hypothetical protein